MKLLAAITSILLLISLAVPAFALCADEDGQSGVIIVRSVNLTPENESALESRTGGAESTEQERSRKITEPCGMSEDELSAALRHELIQYAGDFLAAEEKHGVNAAFLAAIAAQESGWGRYCFKANNIFGFGRKAFDSVPECIDYVAGYLAEHYIAEDGRYFNGATVEGVSVCWCDKAWAQAVNGILYQITEG